MCQELVYDSTMISAMMFESVVVALLSMVGHVYDDGVLVLITAHYLVDNRVVVQGGVVIVGYDVTLLLRQVGSVVVFLIPFALLLRITLMVVNMLSHDMKNCESALLVLASLFVIIHLVIVLQYAFVQSVHTCVTSIKLGLIQYRIVQEETSREVIDGFLGFG